MSAMPLKRVQLNTEWKSRDTKVASVSRDLYNTVWKYSFVFMFP